MGRADPICEWCDYDLFNGDGHESFVTFFEMRGVRGDLNVECPSCGHVNEVEIKVLTFG